MPDGIQERRARGRPRSTPDNQGGTLQSLDRALSVLTGLAQHGRSSLTDISLRLGVPTATAYRILITLQKHGFAEFDETRLKANGDVLEGIAEGNRLASVPNFQIAASAFYNFPVASTTDGFVGIVSFL